MRRLSLIMALGLLLMAGRSTAQRTISNPINLIVSDTAIDVIIQEFERQSGYHFYYDRSQFDSLRFSIVINNQPLDKALEQTFNNTPFHFTVMPDRQWVFLTKGASIKTSLPDNFFARAAKDTARRDVAAVPDYGDKKKVRADASIENKLFEIGSKNNSGGPGTVTIAGHIRNLKSGEPIVGATVSIPNTSIGTATDQYGYFSLTIPKGRYVLNIQGIGMKDTRRQVMLYTGGKLDVDMEERVVSLKEVIVSAQKVANVRNVQMGTERLTIRAIKQIPTAFGEADIIRAVLTLPGVKSVGEASTGFNVRGGSADQNLILFNDATIYNPSHFFGFFSAFNPDIVKDVELYKSSIPAKYGGRLSSVLDISSREGNKKEITGSAGLGLITSRFNIEGPIQKDKTSFILGARTTYAKWLLNLLPDEYENSKASFYDVNLHISHQFNNKNNLYVTGYTSKDRFNLNNDTTYGYNNSNVVVKWKHIFNNKLTGFLTAGYDRYAYHIQSEKNEINAYKLNFDINQLNAKADFTWYLTPAHTLDFGASTIRYKLNPGNYGPIGKESLIVADDVAAEQAQESAIYLSEKWNVTPELSVQAGARFSYFQYLGPGNINQYPKGLPKNEDNITGVKTYGKGDVIQTYNGPEWRVSARYLVTPTFSVKAGYNTQRQYIHMLSNTTAISPTDIWKLSDPNIKPQYGDQVSLGLYKNLRSNSIETSVEVYYKRIKNYLDYKSGANLVMNDHIETDVIGTKGKAYGLELMIKKQNGKLNGWISYTYSRILLTMDDSTSGELLNGGKEYPANYDKPHDFTMVGNYRFTHRFSISLNATYSTGRPITVPIGRYYYGGSWRALYADRNAYRIPDYFRTDFAMILEGNHKVKQKFHNSWTFGLYNITGRKNPYSVYFTSENGRVNGYKLSIFGNIIPFINYNIRF
ncbi:TonB-dependent receptor [Paraflavitalea sp. CAU 1676]|uniref:TonB-dependent receptor n=1 Tax=Paraflavitalea sp. CAU 1676 TaxID=3032598 RepID=UPI0023DCAB3E|nr:TonB-dependent receptor [Paraflavitalea sp. CAU 1676]MDF2187176.1 TonB-dependent receptor [Paraflavitalea sp. CAU 1676]